MASDLVKTAGSFLFSCAHPGKAKRRCNNHAVANKTVNIGISPQKLVPTMISI